MSDCVIDTCRHVERGVTSYWVECVATWKHECHTRPRHLFTEPHPGDLAVCSRGIVGIITSDERQDITYEDCTTGRAWLGVNAVTGEPWSSRTPRIIGHVEWSIYLDEPPVT